ncbi:MAG: phage integrase family protein [Phycisphaerae bacterium]|nr:phage integrase family protein [Phycisphaerae bacterium]
MRKRTNRGLTFPPEVLSREEVMALMDACAESPAGARNRALIVVLYRTGLRITEALALEPKDLDLEGGAVRVLRGKGGRSRTVGIDPGAAAVVGEWLAVREAWVAEDRSRAAAVFCQRDGRRLESSYIRVLVPRLSGKAGIEKRVHAHGLRHTHAAELRAEGVDIGIISKQLGHRCISTTARYLDHIMPMAVVEAIRGRLWT